MHQKSYRTEYARVHGLGVAHDGVGHWWHQRVSAVGLVILTPFFLFPFARALGSDHETMVATYQNGWNALVAILFVITAFWHLKLGLQVVIEDYIHGKALRTVCLVVNTLLTIAFGAAGVFAIARIAFSA